MNALTVEELARRIDAEIDGDPRRVITGIAGIRDAEEGDIAFVANRRYAADAETTRASAVIVPRDWDRECPAALLKTERPDAAFARVAELFVQAAPKPPPGIHETALIGKGCSVGRDVSIGPYAVIDDGCRIGDGCVLHAHTVLGRNAALGASCLLYPHVSIREGVEIGNRVIVHNGAVIGSDGFGYTVDEHGVRTKIPQVGTVVIGDDVEIGANVTIDRARFGKTRIGKGVKIDNLVQIAHNVVIEDHAVIVAQVGISGSSSVGSRAILAGQSGVAGHLRIGEGAIVGAQGGVTKDVAANSYVSGYPAMPHEKASRIHAHLMRLPLLKDHVKDLEDRLARLENKRA